MQHRARPYLPQQVMEDVSEGPVVTGVSSRVARSAEELRAAFNSGRANRDSNVSGSAAHEQQHAVACTALGGVALWLRGVS